MSHYLISPEAQQSLKQIKNYSIKHFGSRQTTAYMQQIMHRFNDLADNPSLGKARNEIKNGYFSSFIGSHTIYYRINRRSIEIIDILHQSMEPGRNLRSNSNNSNLVM